MAVNDPIRNINLNLNIYLSAMYEQVSETSSLNSAEYTGDVVRNLEVNSFLSSKRITKLFIQLSLTLKGPIYYVVYRKLVKISSDKQFLKFHTVLYR